MDIIIGLQNIIINVIFMTKIFILKENYYIISVKKLVKNESLNI